jgi:hypothetical protein
MSAFRRLLACIFGVIVVYTAVVIANHGLGLLPIFFGDILKMGWLGLAGPTRCWQAKPCAATHAK